jgi:hypothetical protein
MPYGSYSGAPQELLMLRQLLGQTSPNYAQVAMLIGLLLVVIYRPERIRLHGMFRAACALLAISLVLPPLVAAAVGLLATTASSMARSTGSDYMMLAGLLNVVEPALVAISIFLGIYSLLPPLQHDDRAGPAHHPIDS